MLRVVKWLLLLSVLGIVLGSAVIAVTATEAALHPIHMRRASDTAALAFSAAHAVNGNARQVVLGSTDGVVLKAWYLTPAQPNGNAVIACHGVADSGFGVMGDALLFLRNGYAVLVPDSRGHGESGGFVTYGILESKDIELWQTWLSNEHGGRIFGFGESLGGADLLQSIPQGAKFEAIVAESSFASFDQVASERLAHYGHVPGWVASALVGEGELYAQLRFGINLQRARPKEAVKNSDTPILLIHGLDDRETSAWHSQEIARNARDARLWLVPHARHTGAYGAAPAEFERRVLAFYSNPHGV